MTYADLHVSEIISDLENMVYSHILTFEKNTKAKPQKIIMFRDGVSEGQYGLVVKLVPLHEFF